MIKLINYEPLAGDDISNTIHYCIDLSKTEDALVSFSFNGVLLKVNKDSNPDEILKEFHNVLSLKSQTPEAIEQRKKHEEYVKQCQERLDTAQYQMLSLDFNNKKEVLEWCNTIFENKIVGTTIDNKNILNFFMYKGIHQRNQYSGSMYSEHVKYQWLIGQFLEGIANNSIPGVFSYYYNEIIKELDQSV